MLRTDRLAGAVRGRGKSAAAACGDRLASALRGRKRSLLYVGTALALAGAGSASAATVGGSVPAPSTSAALTGPASGVAAPTAAHATAHRPPAHQVRVLSWWQVRDAINRETNPAAARRGLLPLADRVMPVGTSGPQSWMPLSPPQLANATTIVRQALAKRMGVRSAVIAVATAMQESQLLDLHYGDLDSVGLFQQRPSMGWGTAAQIMRPAYAVDAFLTTLRDHEGSDPSWARQPLWANAQAVQASGLPLAYAKWESQAAFLVKQIATRLL